MAGSVAACSDDGGGAADATTTTAPIAPTTAPSTPAGSTAPPGIDLRDPTALILQEVPSGFLVQDDELADTGPVDLARAALSDPLQDAETVLEALGFKRGHQRTWRPLASTEDNTLFVYEFSTPENAEAFLDHWLAGLRLTSSGVTLEEFVPPYMEPAYGVKGGRKNSSTAVVVAAHGPYAVQAVVQGEPGVDQTNAAVELAARQVEKLPE
jgi:hypothetical protein